MILLNTLFTRRRSALLAPVAPEPPCAEAIIQALRQYQVAEPICYIVCQADLPLLGAVPGRAFVCESYLLIFAPKKYAQAFMASCRRLLKPEPLSIVAVDSAARLQELALTPAHDSSYPSPPCGLMLNFVYSVGASGASLSPRSVKRLDAYQIVNALCL